MSMRRVGALAATSVALSLPAVLGVAGASPAHASGPPTCDGQKATIVGTQGKDKIFGTPGKDVIVGLNGDDVIDGRGGDDVICGNAGGDRLKGGDGNDRLFGQLGRVYDSGRGAGVFALKEDLLIGGPGSDLLNPGRDPRAGKLPQNVPDTISYRGASKPINANLAKRVVLGEGRDTIVFVPGMTFEGTAFDDKIKATLQDDFILGLAGDDTIITFAGDDDVEDTFTKRNDDDAVRTGPGDDRVNSLNGADVFRLGAGNDTADGFSASAGVTMNGGAGDDNLDGGRFADYFDGGAGTDRGGDRFPAVDICLRIETGRCTQQAPRVEN